MNIELSYTVTLITDDMKLTDILADDMLCPNTVLGQTNKTRRSLCVTDNRKRYIIKYIQRAIMHYKAIYYS
jgi:hypothetical protein